MNAEAMSEFFYMGGYASYVWPSFIITFVVLALNIVSSRLSRRHAIRQLQRQVELENHESKT